MMLLGSEMRSPARVPGEPGAHPRFRGGTPWDAVGGAVVEDVVDWLAGFDPFEKADELLVADGGPCAGRSLCRRGHSTAVRRDGGANWAALIPLKAAHQRLEATDAGGTAVREFLLPKWVKS
jgi:hypothetical protein